MFKKSRFLNYIAYAFGEIILVMIGILLALQVNNLNEKRKQKNELISIFKTIVADLKRDTLSANSIIDYYKLNSKLSKHVLEGKINKDSVLTNSKYRSLATIYRPFVIQQKGYELIKDYSNQHKIKNDSLITIVTQFYGPLINIIDDSNQFIKDEVLGNIKKFKKYTWFVDWTQGRITDEIFEFIINSDEYKKDVASHELLAGRNHLLFVSSYKKSASQLLQIINKQLEDK